MLLFSLFLKMTLIPEYFDITYNIVVLNPIILTSSCYDKKSGGYLRKQFLSSTNDLCFTLPRHLHSRWDTVRGSLYIYQ